MPTTIDTIINPLAFDSDLRTENKQKIQASVPHRPDIALVFMDFPKNSFASKLGPLWVRFDTMKCFPGELISTQTHWCART